MTREERIEAARMEAEAARDGRPSPSLDPVKFLEDIRKAIRARLEDAARRKAEAIREAEARRREFEAEVAIIYPVARKALDDARTRGGMASSWARQAAIARETARARARLCELFLVGEAEMKRIIAAGEARDGTPARVAQADARAAARARADAANRTFLDALGRQLNRSASMLPHGPAAPLPLPPLNNNPFR